MIQTPMSSEEERLVEIQKMLAELKNTETLSSMATYRSASKLAIEPRVDLQAAATAPHVRREPDPSSVHRRSKSRVLSNQTSETPTSLDKTRVL